MRLAIYISITVGVLIATGPVLAQMSSTNFEIRFDSANFGGSNTSSSANYQLRDTVGDSGPGRSTSTNFQVGAGLREGIFDQVITFDVFAQSGTANTATGLAGNIITTTTTGLAINDYIVLIQDEGASQVSAIGRITAVGAGNITVDSLTNGGAAPVIDGVNDFVYELSGSSAAIGTLSQTTVETSVIGFNVSADLDNGYVIQVFDDGNLRDGANDIDDIADGTVTAGDEEYGARSSDTTLVNSTFDTQDTALTTGFQDVVTESSNLFEDRNFVTLKAAMDATTNNGNYAHALSFIISGNY